MDLSSKIAIMEEYGMELIGIPYVWWLDDFEVGWTKEPFWATNESLPSLQEVKQAGMCCTAVLNLIRRRLGLSVPGVANKDPVPGGTGAWEEFLNPYLVPFDPTKDYPVGTIFFRPYMSFEDQGHIGIKLHGETFLHCYVYEADPKPGFQQPGCCLDSTWKTSHSWIQEGYYLFTAPPEAWLF